VDQRKLVALDLARFSVRVNRGRGMTSDASLQRFGSRRLDISAKPPLPPVTVGCCLTTSASLALSPGGVECSNAVQGLIAVARPGAGPLPTYRLAGHPRALAGLRQLWAAPLERHHALYWLQYQRPVLQVDACDAHVWMKSCAADAGSEIFEQTEAIARQTAGCVATRVAAFVQRLDWMPPHMATVWRQQATFAEVPSSCRLRWSGFLDRPHR